MIVVASGIVSESLPDPACPSRAAGRGIASLVLTAHGPLRERLRSVTVARGCVCTAPETVAAAWRTVATGCQLAFIDVARPLQGRADEARAIAEALARRPGVLLAVCGSPMTPEPAGPRGADDDECWARQVGAFVYLPGVGTDAGIALVVDEARRIFRGLR